MTKEEQQELNYVSNLVLNVTHANLIKMLHNSIAVAKNKHEKKAYTNVIEYIKKQEKERIEKLEPLCKKPSDLILPSSVTQKPSIITL